MDSTTTLADLAVAYPAASRVFHRHGLDFCCGGRRPLEDAAAAKGLDAAALLEAIAAESREAGDRPRWDTRPLSEIVDHIVSYYHARLRTELPELVAMAARVEERHAEKPTCPVGLRAHLETIHQAVLDHLYKEEQILFPMIVAGRGAGAGGPIHVMEIEHDDHAVNLAKTRHITGDLVPPPEACTTWRALYGRLVELEAELMDHIHLENNVLFPRALRA